MVIVTREDKIIETPVYIKDPRVPDAQQGYADFAALDPIDQRVALNVELARIEACLQRGMKMAEALGLTVEMKVIHARVRNFREIVTHLNPQPA